MRRLLLVLCASAISMVALADREGFYYTNWTVDATISAQNVWTIHEQEDVYFDEPRHGIYRYIPLHYFGRLNDALPEEPENTPSREYFVEVDVTNTEGAMASVYDDENNNRIIRFGDPDREVTGAMSYAFDYTYGYRDDRIDQRDFIFHTLKPADIEETVEEFSFNLKFEKPLPEDIAQRLIIYTGQWGETAIMDDIKDLVVTPTQISGTVYHLEPRQALTLYAELPQGFWEDTKTVPTWPSKLFCWLSIALALWILYFELFHKQIPPSKVVEFYPPDEITPSEVGKIIDDTTDPIDLTALIPWLAQRGYLTIEEVKKNGLLFDKKDIKLTKLKDLPQDAPEYQRCIMDMLFEDGETEQLMSKLGRRPKKVEAAKKALDNSFRKDKELTEWKQVGKMCLLILFSTLAWVLAAPEKMINWDFAIPIGIFWVVGFLLAWILRSVNSVKDPFRKKSIMMLIRIGRILAFAVFVLFIYCICWSETTEDFYLSPAEGLLLLFCCFFVWELSGRLVFDTPYRQSLRGRLLGFKEFIETADQQRLKLLVDDNPEYFYSVLPYAMIFDLTNKWVDQFKNIEIKQTNWYSSSSPTGSYAYISSLSNSLNTTVNHAISTSGASSSGGGGGFSGGGGGGGGGGSW